MMVSSNFFFITTTTELNGSQMRPRNACWLDAGPAITSRVPMGPGLPVPLSTDFSSKDNSWSAGCPLLQGNFLTQEQTQVSFTGDFTIWASGSKDWLFFHSRSLVIDSSCSWVPDPKLQNYTTNKVVWTKGLRSFASFLENRMNLAWINVTQKSSVTDDD